MTDAAATGGYAPWNAFSTTRRWIFLSALFLVATSSYLDRNILPVLLEEIKKEFLLSDAQLGLLAGAPFALCYAGFTLVFGGLSDRLHRKWILLLTLVLWSLATIACGLVGSVTLLFLARMVVGAGEGGAIPASNALIGEYFPPQSRSSAFAVFLSSSTLGGLIALVGGAFFAERYGWRAAFIAMGALSVPIALYAFAVLKEPPRAPHPEGAKKPHVFADLSALLKKRSIVTVLLGLTLYAFFAYGPIPFIPAFLQRSMKISLTEAGATYGLWSTMGTIVGTLLGGVITDRLVKRDRRWLFRLPALGLFLCWPFTTFAFLSPALGMFLPAIAVAIGLLFVSLPALFTAVQTVCGSGRRGVASALVMAAMTAIGMTLGPLFTGAISDALAPSMGDQSLRYAVLIMSLVLPAASVLLLTRSGSLLKEAED